MDPVTIKHWLDVVQGTLTIAAMVIGGFWAWSRFVVERGLIPATQLDVELRSIGSSEVATVLEITVHIKNKGASALVVTDLRARLRYLSADEEIQVVNDTENAAFGRVKFPHASVLNGIAAERRTIPQKKARPDLNLGGGEFLVVPYDTFVQPDIDQAYSFVTALPRLASYVLLRASFRYELHPSPSQMFVLRLSRKLGIIQYSLDHVHEPHTVERCFRIEQTT